MIRGELYHLYSPKVYHPKPGGYSPGCSPKVHHPNPGGYSPRVHHPGSSRGFFPGYINQIQGMLTRCSLSRVQDASSKTRVYSPGVHHTGSPRGFSRWRINQIQGDVDPVFVIPGPGCIIQNQGVFTDSVFTNRVSSKSGVYHPGVQNPGSHHHTIQVVNPCPCGPAMPSSSGSGTIRHFASRT